MDLRCYSSLADGGQVRSYKPVLIPGLVVNTSVSALSCHQASLERRRLAGGPPGTGGLSQRAEEPHRVSRPEKPLPWNEDFDAGLKS